MRNQLAMLRHVEERSKSALVALLRVRRDGAERASADVRNAETLVERANGTLLAARAALRIGAGLVTIGAPGSALLAHAARGPDALMVRARDRSSRDLLADPRIDAVVVGPAFGVGEGTRQAVRALLEAGKAAVLDASWMCTYEVGL